MQTVELSQEKKSRTLEDDPQFFGGYLNMIRHNIYSISNHVALELGRPSLGNEDAIANSFLTNSRIENLNWNHIYSRTVRLMPVIRVFNFEELPKTVRPGIEKSEGNYGKDVKRMSETLGVLFKEIRDFRNDYSHYFSTETGTDRKRILLPETVIFLNHTFTLALAYTRERMKEVLCDEDYCLVKEMRLVDDEGRITTEGLVFLICMFLERQHAFQFIGKVRGLKGTQLSSFIATREVLMAFCVKLPHDKFVNEERPQRLTLEMIDELNRCPKELYQVITEKERGLFRPVLQKEQQLHLIENSMNIDRVADWDEPTYEEYIEQLTKRVRYENRFADFALRYIDEMDIFSLWRFHVVVGKLELAHYDKLLDEMRVPRKIVEDVKAFDKLSAFSEKEATHKQVNVHGVTNSFEQFKPHYNTQNNKIGLRRRSKCAELMDRSSGSDLIPVKLVQPLAEAFLSLHELPKIILLEYLDQGAAEQIINEFVNLSNRQLLKFDFIEKIDTLLPKDWSPFKKRTPGKKRDTYSEGKMAYLKSRKALLNEVLLAYGLNDKQIPSRILHHWLKIEEVDSERSFSDRVKLMKDDCKQRLKVMNRHEADHSVWIPMVGEMASFLAKDIVNMIVDKDIKKKCTSFYYDRMQECLAFYADNDMKELFQRIIIDLKLCESGGHPFIANVLGVHPQNTSKFYRAYLMEKADKRSRPGEEDLSWLVKTFYFSGHHAKTGKRMTFIRMPVDKSDIPYTMRQWEEKGKGDLGIWLENITRMNRKAVDLPTNIFDGKLIELLGKELSDGGVEYDRGLNYNELLKVWWRMRGDSTQSYYRSEREYEVYGEKIHFLPDSEQRFEAYYAKAFENVNRVHRKMNVRPCGVELERLFKRVIAGTEKKIRMLQEEDRLMLLMVEQLMRKSGTEWMENVKLTGIDRLLNESIDVQLHLDFVRDYQIKNIPNVSISRTIATVCKRKNYTLLRKYRYDRRLPELFGYHTEMEIQLDWLEKELEAYNKVKQIVFDVAFDLEKYVIEKDEQQLRQLFVDRVGTIQCGNIKHWHYLEWLKDKGMISDEEKLFLGAVRNAFAHNQFPPLEIVAGLITLIPSETIAEQIADTYQQIVQRGVIDDI